MPVYTIEEVAKEMKVHPNSVRKWIKDGKLQVLRLGHRTVRITEEEINRFKREGL